MCRATDSQTFFWQVFFKTETCAVCVYVCCNKNTRLLENTHEKTLEKISKFWLKFYWILLVGCIPLQKFLWFWQRQAKIWFYFFFSLAWSRIAHFTKEYPPPLFTAFTAVSVAELLLLVSLVRRRRRRDNFPSVAVCVAEYFFLQRDFQQGVTAVHSLQLASSN